MEFASLTHVTYVIGRVQLNLESIWLVELERFLRIAVGELQIALLQLQSRLVSVEAGYSEVVVIDLSRFAITLFNAKERFPDTQNMDLRRLLFQWQSEEFLVELRCAVKVGHPHGHVVYADGFEFCLLRGGLRAAHQRGEGEGELAAGQPAALEIVKHLLYGLYHQLLLQCS